MLYLQCLGVVRCCLLVPFRSSQKSLLYFLLLSLLTQWINKSFQYSCLFTFQFYFYLLVQLLVLCYDMFLLCKQYESEENENCTEIEMRDINS